MPVEHYENFPVASWLLPARMRAPIEAIYAFARSADDIADEGDLTDPERLDGLARYGRALDAIERGETPAEAPFSRLAVAAREYDLPIPLLRDLLDAFAQDVTQRRYATYAELLDYSRRSANPIGRLVLHCFETAETGARPSSGPAPARAWPRSGPGLAPIYSREQSDAICSALQFINFWQDVAIDWQKGRVYIPQEDMARFGVDEGQIAEGRADARWGELMAFECERARALLFSGRPLGAALPGRLGLEIRATIEGGATILDRIDAIAGDVFRHRPALRKRDWPAILVKSMLR